MKAQAFKEGRGFSVQTLYRWSAHLSRAPSVERAAGRVRLARVIRRAESVEPRTGAPRGAVWVELDGARIVVPEGVEQTTLTAVLLAVRATAGGGAR